MELIVSCERLPKFRGLNPNTIAVIYLDQNYLETKIIDVGKSETQLQANRSMNKEPDVAVIA